MSSPSVENSHCYEDLLKELKLRQEELSELSDARPTPSAPEKEDLETEMENVILDKNESSKTECGANLVYINRNLEELKKVEWKRQLVLKEKRFMEELFKVKEQIIERELKEVISKLSTTNVEYPSNSVNLNAGNLTQLLNETVSYGVPIPNLDIGLNHEELVKHPSALYLLKTVDRVYIQKTKSSKLDTMFKILDGHGNLLFNAKQMLKCAVDNSEIRRRFEVHIYDRTGEEVISCVNHRFGTAEIFVSNKKVGELTLKSTWVKPVLLIKDVSAQTLLKVKGRDNYTFDIVTPNKARIGAIEKDSLFHNRRATHINFPADLDLDCKAAVLVCNFAIKCLHPMTWIYYMAQCVTPSFYGELIGNLE